MKKYLFLAGLITASFISTASEPTAMDETITNEFKQLNELEDYLENNEATLEELKISQPNLLQDVTLAENNTFVDDPNDDTFGIPPFLWGCVFGLLGILLVFILTDKDKSLTKKAAMGCLVTYGTIAAVYLVLIILGLSTSLAYY